MLTYVYLVPDLRNNLLSLGQLQEKSLTIVFSEGTCKVYHLEKGFIMRTYMSKNCMFILIAERGAVAEASCLQTTSQDIAHLWHKRFGHLSYKGLETLKKENMVQGLPDIVVPTRVCEECMKGKQHRLAIPNKSTGEQHRSWSLYILIFVDQYH